MEQERFICNLTLFFWRREKNILLHLTFVKDLFINLFVTVLECYLIENYTATVYRESEKSVSVSV